MKRYVYILVAVLTIGLFSHVLASDAAAAMEIFVKFSDRLLWGESVEEMHPDWIEALSISHKISQPASSTVTSGGSTGRANFEDIAFAKLVDRSSPKLKLFCAQGRRIPEVEIHFVVGTREGKILLMKYKMTNVMVTSVSSGATKGENRPTEEVTLNFEKIEWSYNAIDPGTGKRMGEIQSSWDIMMNRGG